MHRHRITTLVCLIAILGTLLLLFREGKLVNQSQHGPLAVTAVLSGKLVLPLAPENISTIPLYHVHKNLWDTVIFEHGEPALARLVETSDHGLTFHFEVQSNAQFSNGRRVKSGDILFSLKRLMGKQPGGHFNLKSMIKKIDEIDETRFEIQLKEPVASFLFLLSTPEMGIVPKEACDDEGNLRDLSVTSGPYKVSGQVDAKKITLVKNPHFLRADPQAPNEINIFLGTTTDEMVNAATQNHMDFLEAYNSTGTEALQKLRNNPELAIKITKPSYSTFLVVNPDRIDEAQRHALVQLVDKNFARFYNIDPELEQRSFELLPPGTFGSLEATTHSASIPKAALPKKLKLGAVNPKMPLAKSMTDLFKDAGIEVDMSAWGGDATDSYDVLLYGQGMNTDFPEIEFHLNMVSPYSFIKAKDVEKKMILSALHSNDRNKRQGIIQKIGSALLREGRIIPLVVRSYVHLYRKDRISIDHITNYDGDIPFWKMQVK